MAGRGDEPTSVGMATAAPSDFGSQNGSEAGNRNGMSGADGTGVEGRAARASEGGSGRKPPVPLDQMRAYRACLNCRNRKSKCDLDINQGRPVSAHGFVKASDGWPCRRCQREARECILGESHRGGRRVRKKDKGGDAPSESSVHPQAAFPSPSNHTPLFSPHPGPLLPAVPHPFTGQYAPREDQERGYPWQLPTPTNTSGSDSRNGTRYTDQNNLTSPDLYRQRAGSATSTISASRPGERLTFHDAIASAELQNPSDALEILAHVADRAEEGDSGSDLHGLNLSSHLRLAPRIHAMTQATVDNVIHYQPIQRGLITTEEIYQLFSSYEQFFHPFFPIIPGETFDRLKLPLMSQREPHLFSAILTVASKDDERIHQICYDHMQDLNSMLLAGSDAGIEAVEAMLLLSQWVSHRPHASGEAGRGEEDRVAWMYTGTAVRLGYFLGIDSASFKQDSREDPIAFKRKRLVWMACYMCDRQVSVRLGKGFWSRGPGPLSGTTSSDFPTLKPSSPGQDDWAMIFQANLELIQIFGNVHDILYSSKGPGFKDMLEGRYAKYLDDFRGTVRNWSDRWGTLTCSAPLKASLMLTYDYLRLYVNAFAYQATISRVLTDHRDGQHTPHRAMPLINASATDARFIYEALDAAQSLLRTLNGFVQPETLRYMPVSYYFFIVYSAVFLYKARATTTMTEDERANVRNMVNQTIDLLEKASVGPNHMGSRYARLLHMLWSKVPKRVEPRDQPRQQNIDPQLQQPQRFLTNNFNMEGLNQNSLPQNGTFSWLDLGATWNFATQNGNAGDFDDMMADTGLSPFDMMAADYSVLEGDNPNLIF